MEHGGRRSSSGLLSRATAPHSLCLTAALSRLFEGTLVHQLVHTMRTSDRSSLQQDVIQQFVTQDTAPSSKGSPQQHGPLDDLTSNLQQLFLHQDRETATEEKSAVQAQQDLSLCHMLSVRTRYKTKGRKNQSSNPELVRKEEHRGWNLL